MGNSMQMLTWPSSGKHCADVMATCLSHGECVVERRRGGGGGVGEVTGVKCLGKQRVI